MLFAVLACASAAEAAGEVALSGATLRDASGAEYRVLDIAAPELSSLDNNGGPLPLADASRAALQALLDAGEVVVAPVGDADRWGVQGARVKAGNADVDAALVAAGWAQVNPESGAHKRLEGLFAAEREAEAARLGLWAHEAHNAADGADPGGLAGRFRVVDGVVLEAAEVRGRVYLNFGEDYRTDFTATFATRAARRFRSEGIEPLDLEGAHVRVRGFVGFLNGPQIELTRTDQLEILEAVAAD